MRKLKELDYQMLLRLNESSIQAGRRQNLSPRRMPSHLHEPYPVNEHLVHRWEGREDIRMSVVLTAGGQTAWLDVSPEEFDAIPEVEMSELDWEAAICPGFPPTVP
ncbi:MAG: hypothetical protein HW388_656 [Dehalococcoidia bacterium]|nr:hypothetical protein [Dehalococcoidia bacterium]